MIDGGFAGAAGDFIEFLDDYYNTDSIDLMISTHPDGDHTAGLIRLVDELKVGEVWMHRPWQYESEVYSYVFKGTSNRRFSESMKKALSSAWDLEKLVKRKGIPITEPFEGLRWADASVRVLGPREAYYRELTKDFGMSAVESLAAVLKGALTQVRERVVDIWDKEALIQPDSDAVSNRNNSSAIIHASLDEVDFLFTGDAGVPALEPALDVRDALGLGEAGYTQLPHHGSKRNVGPGVMDRLLGPKAREGTDTGRVAFVSAAKKGAPTHPSQRVVNAACRRGAKVFVTAGQSMVFKSSDRPMRRGWKPLTPAPFTDAFVEE